MSALKTLLVAALASTAFVGAAYARDVFTVKLQTPVAEQTRVIAQNTIWNCEGDTCVARPDHAATVRACRQFVRQLGAQVVAYGPAGDELTGEEIARCNGQVATQQAQN
jgi:acyl-CoA thioesterase FadM